LFQRSLLQRGIPGGGAAPDEPGIRGLRVREDPGGFCRPGLRGDLRAASAGHGSRCLCRQGRGPGPGAAPRGRPGDWRDWLGRVAGWV